MSMDMYTSMYHAYLEQDIQWKINKSLGRILNVILLPLWATLAVGGLVRGLAFAFYLVCTSHGLRTSTEVALVEG